MKQGLFAGRLWSKARFGDIRFPIAGAGLATHSPPLVSGILRRSARHTRRAGLLLRCGGLLLAAILGTSSQAEPGPGTQGIEELRQLPELTLDRKSEFPVGIEKLKALEAGEYRYGFAFKTPNLVDGPATWRVVWNHPNPQSGSWEVTKPDGTLLKTIAPQTEDISKHPDLAAAFPEGKSVQRFRLANHLLVKATRYQAVLITREQAAPLGSSINVAASERGIPPGTEVREMPVPSGIVPPAQVMELVDNIRAFRGDAEAIAFLEAQFSKRAEKSGNLGSLFTMVWNEAQFGSGREDPTWGSRLNDAAFTSACRAGDYARAFEIMNNLFVTLSMSARFGRLAEVHGILADAYRRGGQNMNPSSYPDRGPAVPSLPAIRHRVMTLRVPYSVEPPNGPPPITRVPAFDERQASALQDYAYQRMNRGDWRGALEWSVWLRDWASDESGNPVQPRNEIWYWATFGLASHLDELGFTEEALALIDAAVAAPYGMNYRGRAKILATLRQLDLRRRVGRPDPETLPKLRELVSRMENHVHFGKAAARGPRINLAEALFDSRQFEEGDRILEELIAEGSYDARWSRLDRWLAAGRTEGVEAELMALLQSTRENGHKISELGLYGRYADFLESSGRLNEALAMRREAIRLARDFNAFTKLPVHLSRIAALLHKLGHANLAAAAAAEARSLVDAGNMPPSTLRDVTKYLAPIVPAAPASPMPAEVRQPTVDLQPHRGLVVPFAGAPWTSYLTLTNPGITTVRGSLEISGPSLKAKEDGQGGDIRIELSDAKAGQPVILPLTLDPGAYRLITVAAPADHKGEGDLEFIWRSSGGVKVSGAGIRIDPSEREVAGAIIQAGDYRSNPFYGVPLHLSYVATDGRKTSPPLRFKASQPARIEIHRLDGTPLAVDATGNGSLLDPGDELFSGTDGAGNLLLDLEGGAAALRIVAYPADPFARDGLNIDVETFGNDAWNLNSRNRIAP